MAAPITWRNVNAPDFGTASEILSRGSATIGAGLSGLQETAEGIQRTKDENTLAGFQNRLVNL